MHPEPPPPFSQLLANWRAGKFEPGLEPYGEMLVTHPSLPKITSAGPCCVFIFDTIPRKHIFGSQAAHYVFKAPPAEMQEDNAGFFRNHLSEEDFNLFSVRSLRYFHKTKGYSSMQRLKYAPWQIYTLNFADGTSCKVLGYDVVLKCSEEGKPHIILTLHSIADDLPNLAEMVHQQYLNDNEVSQPYPDVLMADLEPFFNPQEAQIIFRMAQGKGTPEIAAELNLTLPNLLRIVKDLLKRTHCYSVPELLEKRIWLPTQPKHSAVW